MGEGYPLPRGKELTEGPIGRRGSLTHAQTDKQRDWSHRISWVRRVTVEGLSENTEIHPCGFMDLARGWPCVER